MMFTEGDIVEVLPHATKQADGTWTPDKAMVVDPCEPTDMVLVTGERVGHYVVVHRDAYPAKLQSYHESSLRRVG